MRAHFRSGIDSRLGAAARCDSALRLGVATRRCPRGRASGPHLQQCVSAVCSGAATGNYPVVLQRCVVPWRCGVRLASAFVSRVSLRLLRLLASPCFFLANSACRRNFKGLGFWFRELRLRLWVQGLGFSPALGLEVCGKGCSAAAVL